MSLNRNGIRQRYPSTNCHLNLSYPLKPPPSLLLLLSEKINKLMEV